MFTIKKWFCIARVISVIENKKELKSAEIWNWSELLFTSEIHGLTFIVFAGSKTKLNVLSKPQQNCGQKQTHFGANRQKSYSIYGPPSHFHSLLSLSPAGIFHFFSSCIFWWCHWIKLKNKSQNKLRKSQHGWETLNWIFFSFSSQYKTILCFTQRALFLSFFSSSA